jgi:hypothetical protein
VKIAAERVRAARAGERSGVLAAAEPRHGLQVKYDPDAPDTEFGAASLGVVGN